MQGSAIGKARSTRSPSRSATNITTRPSRSSPCGAAHRSGAGARGKDPERATNLALEAHHLARDLVPAAAIAGRFLAARGNTKRAATRPPADLEARPASRSRGRLRLRAPRRQPARPPRPRQQLARRHQHSIESPIALAIAAIEAQRLRHRPPCPEAAHRRAPDPARLHADGAHRGRAASATRDGPRMARPRRPRAARSRLDR